MDLNEYQKRIMDTWISNDKDLERIILGICGESGEIAELFKKYFRGDYEYESTKVFISRRDQIVKELGDIFYYICMLCNKYNFSAEEILLENINKLSKRKEEGKIKGSGSDR